MDAPPPDAERGGDGSTSPGTLTTPTDLIDHLVRLLSGPSACLLLLKGPPGSGRTSLLRSLAARLRGPRLCLLYRLRPLPGPTAGAAAADFSQAGVTAIDVVGDLLPPPGTSEPATGTGGEAMPGTPGPTGVAYLTQTVIPEMARRGQGALLIDSWDRSAEASYLALDPRSRSLGLGSTSISLGREQLEEIPIPTILAVPPSIDVRMDESCDGIIELGTETWDGPPLRVVALSNFRGAPVLESRYVYSLDRGEFYCRTRSTAGLVPPIGAPEDDPSPEPFSVWPGNRVFASAFGRLHYHALTGIELPVGAPSSLFRAVTVPLAAHVLRSGGRVVWIPSTTSTPASLVAEIARHVPVDFLRERFRVLSASGHDPGVGELRSVILPVRTDVAADADVRPATARAVSPIFTDAYQFLRATDTGKPALFVLSLDGLRALALVSGSSYDASTFPLIVSTYARLPGFIGVGVGNTGDPLSTALIPSLETHLKAVERYGRLLLFGLRPPTACFMMDWKAGSERYDLVRVS